MLKNLFVQLYLILQPLFGLSQSLSDQLIRELPKSLEECSGMAFIAPNALVIINDSGNDPELFICDTLGEVKQKIALVGIPNRDWESLAYADGILYIGDFGNNANQRQNLEIFKINVSKLLSNQEWALSGSIKFRYPEQLNFPPEDSELYYDLEAMIVERDSIFLFTKNRTKPFDGIVKVYGLSTQQEVQDAKLLKEFKTNVGLKHFNWVSGACLGPNGDDLFLLGYSKLWYVENWRNNPNPILHSYRLGNFSQKEAIALSGNSLYIGEEATPQNPQSLSKLDVSLFLNKYNKLLPRAFKLNQNSYRQGDTLILAFQDPKYFIGQRFHLYNNSGTEVVSSTIDEEMLKNGGLQIPLNGLPSGTYVLSIEGRYKKAFVIRIN